MVIQLWLLAAALEAALSAEASVLLPVTLASLALFLVNGGLLWYVTDFDRAPAKRGRRCLTGPARRSCCTRRT